MKSTYPRAVSHAIIGIVVSSFSVLEKKTITGTFVQLLFIYVSPHATAIPLLFIKQKSMESSCANQLNQCSTMSNIHKDESLIFFDYF